MIESGSWDRLMQFRLFQPVWTLIIHVGMNDTLDGDSENLQRQITQDQPEDGQEKMNFLCTRQNCSILFVKNLAIPRPNFLSTVQRWFMASFGDSNNLHIQWREI